MHRVYLLLRNNQQTGPHSLDELLQMQINSNDLIWIEGESYGWQTASEIPRLHNYLKQSAEHKTGFDGRKHATERDARVNSRNVFVRLPAVQHLSPSTPEEVSIEDRAELLRKKVQSIAAAERNSSVENIGVHAGKVDYTGWAFKKKEKRSVNSKILIVFINALVLIAVIGWWTTTKDSSEKKKSEVVVTQKSNTSEPVEFQGESSVIVNAEETKVDQPIRPNEPTAVSKGSTAQEKLKKKTMMVAEVQQPASPGENQAITNEVSAEENVPQQPTQTPEKKRRTLKEVIHGLFAKEDATEAGQQASSASTKGERTTRKRGDASGQVAPVSFTDAIDIRLQKSEDDWMMGVQNLKVKLYNNSDVKLSSATIQLLYYSEDNVQLDRKTIQFSNVPAKKSQTIAAPDHRTADHVTYQILSAIGEGR